MANINPKAKKIIELLKYSPMTANEKLAWIKLLPYMSEKQINNFTNIIRFESSKILDLALRLLEKRSLEKMI